MMLSIITINYNNAEGLKKTIDSVKKQSLQPNEFIIIDGGSTDGSLEIIKDNKEMFSYWQSKPDKGIYNAMNIGTGHATCEYLLFLNSDDVLLHTNTLSEVYPHLGKEDLVYGNVEAIIKGKLTVKQYPEKITFNTFFSGWGLPHQGTFIRRNLLIKMGLYQEHLRVAADAQSFANAVMQQRATYKYIPLTIAYCEDGGLSRTAEGSLTGKNEVYEFLKKEYPLLYDDYYYFSTIEERYKKIIANPVIKTFIKTWAFIKRKKVSDYV